MRHKFKVWGQRKCPTRTPISASVEMNGGSGGEMEMDQ